MGNYQCAGANNQCANGGGKRGNMSLGANCSYWDMEKLVQGSVKALVEYGFDSVKLDSGFYVGQNLSLWAEVLNKSGRPVMIENCHQGDIAPGMNSSWAGLRDHNCTGLGRADGNTDYSDCPFTFWRTTGDPYPGTSFAYSSLVPCTRAGIEWCRCRRAFCMAAKSPTTRAGPGRGLTLPCGWAAERHADWGTIMRELDGLRKVKNHAYGGGTRANSVPYNADPPRSRPGGWAYPGTMTLGDGGSVNASGVLNGGLTFDENAVHFGGE